MSSPLPLLAPGTPDVYARSAHFTRTSPYAGLTVERALGKGFGLEVSARGFAGNRTVESTEGSYLGAVDNSTKLPRVTVGMKLTYSF